MATTEARNMWFTRAAMSMSRCVKLLHMLGLHRLDDPNAEFEMMPTLLPPKDWTELEGRNLSSSPKCFVTDQQGEQRGEESSGARLL